MYLLCADCHWRGCNVARGGTEMTTDKIVIDGIVTRVDGRLTERRPYGAGRVFYQKTRPALVTLGLSNGDSMDVPWGDELPALHSNWRVTVECIGDGDQCTGNG